MNSPEPSLLKSVRLVDLIALAALWLIAVIVVNPIGNFPLNDDWSYGRTVKYLLEHGDFRPVGWTSMPFITQAFWGALFCLPHGFSFTALRFSTLTLSLAGVLGLYLLIWHLRRSRSLAFICALLLAFNPIYFALSNSFMADVPFTTMVILLLFLFIRYFQTGSVSILVVATVVAMVATLCRQLGLAIPLAFTATLLLKHGFDKRRLALAFAPLILVFGSWAVYTFWLKTTGRLPALYSEQTNKLLHVLSKPWTVPVYLAFHGWNALMYLGCFLLPLLVLLMPARARARVTVPAKAALVLFSVWSVVRFIAKPGLMPVRGNILDPRGIGPLLLQDTELLNLPHVAPLPASFWVIVTALSLVGVGLLIFCCSVSFGGLFSAGESGGHTTAQDQNPAASATDDSLKTGAGWGRVFSRWANVCRNRMQGSDRTIGVFLLMCTLIYLAPLVISGFFDRYLLTPVVLLMAFLVMTVRAPEAPPARWPRFAVAFLLVCFAAYAVAGTKDYLAWNRERWIALADLQQAHIPPESIDGGFEFNGWYLYDPKYHPSGTKSDWWVADNEYLLSFGDMDGFERFKEYDFPRWLPPSQGKILVLKRKASEQASSK